MIKFESVFLKYVNEFYALYNFNCEIKSHTLFVGDETNASYAIMRTLSKIDKNYEGNIFVDSNNLRELKDKDLSVAYLPEKPVLFKHKSIQYNLSFPLKIRKINKKTIKNNVNSLFLQYKLKNFNKKIKKLSLSEQKIIALLRTLIRQPKYVLIENFFENFDDNYLDLTLKILNVLKQKSIIIACEKDESNIKHFNNFKTINLNSTTKKKED